VRRACFVFEAKGACTSALRVFYALHFLHVLLLTVRRTLFVNHAGLEHAKNLVAGYKQGKIGEMNQELWKAKKIVDSTLHPGMLCEGLEGSGC
jgi:hypothetical protein